jgi:hypothetical protein
MADTWQTHCRHMANTWPTHGRHMAMSWQTHGIHDMAIPPLDDSASRIDGILDHLAGAWSHIPSG